MWVVLVAAIVIVLIGLWIVFLYSGLIRKRNRVDNAWAQVEVELGRRHDLVPHLVATVQGSAADECGTLDSVTQARAAATSAKGPVQTGAAEETLGQEIGRLFAVAEASPELKANQNFLDLRAQLKDTAEKIAISGQAYNDTVLTYNKGIRTFPAVAFAGMLDFSKRESFQFDEGESAVPTVSFTPASTAAASAAVSAPETTGDASSA